MQIGQLIGYLIFLNSSGLVFKVVSCPPWEALHYPPKSFCSASPLFHTIPKSCILLLLKLQNQFKGFPESCTKAEITEKVGCPVDHNKQVREVYKIDQHLLKEVVKGNEKKPTGLLKIISMKLTNKAVKLQKIKKKTTRMRLTVSESP